MKVKNEIELREALASGEKTIELVSSIQLMETIKLGPGQKLVAGEKDILLSFIQTDGVALSGDNEIQGLAIQTRPDRRAIYIDSLLEDLGDIGLRDLTLTGMVQLMTRGKNKTLSIWVDGLDIVSADARAYPQRPMKYGVVVHQGAFTVYNFNPREGSHISFHGENISLGRKNAPVLGSGLFISGFNDQAGPVTVEKLTTGAIYSNGMVPPGQPNLITGAIFIVYGVHAKDILSKGEVTSYGTNDMVLDVWGQVDQWVTKKEVTSYGPSGIGFVNFGRVKNFKAEEAIKTYGLGARGFNQYDGTIEKAQFKRIETKGDGSIGMQFSKAVGEIKVLEGISTQGSTGQTLVKGVIKELQADAISVLEGGSIKKLSILGDLVVGGQEVVAYHVDGGRVDRLEFQGQIKRDQEGSKALLIENGGQSDLKDLEEYINK
ncbi:MAG: hypothetical protein Q4E37_00685 [Tissierellia bacterium]|nr:hypothetical protein [Tissierellia bacterium]